MFYKIKLNNLLTENNDFLSKTSPASPVNLETGKFFTGINAINLSLQKKGNVWATYNEIAGIGSTVKKGEKSTIVESWSKTEESNEFEFNTKALFSVKNQSTHDVKVESNFQSPESLLEKLDCSQINSENISDMFTDKVNEYNLSDREKYLVRETAAFLLESRLNSFLKKEHQIERNKDIKLSDHDIPNYRKIVSIANKLVKQPLKYMGLPDHVKFMPQQEAVKTDSPKKFNSTVDRNRAISEFIELAQGMGLELDAPDLKADGRINSVYAKGQENRTQFSGRYKFHLDGVPNGWVKNWRNNSFDNYQYSFEKGEFEKTLSKEVIQHIKVGKVSKEDLEAEKVKEMIKITSIVNTLEADKAFATDSHPYIKIKGITVENVYEDKYRANNLIVPIKDTKGLVKGLQRIYPNKDGDIVKFYQKGSSPSGGFHLQGKSLNESEEIIIAEGYSTTNSIYRNHPNKENISAVSALSSNNLENVVKEINKELPDKRITIFPDNDNHLKLANSQLKEDESHQYNKPSIEYVQHLASDKINVVECPELQEDKTIIDFNDLESKHPDFLKNYLSASYNHFQEKNENIIKSVVLNTPEKEESHER